MIKKSLFLYLVIIPFSSFCLASPSKSFEGVVLNNKATQLKDVWIRINNNKVNGYLGCNYLKGEVSFTDDKVYLKWFVKSNVLCPVTIRYKEKNIIKSMKIMNLKNEDGKSSIKGSYGNYVILFN
ncbi:hypothetical protein B7489_08790 [Vibrio alginolyticus]|uniref:hypothetical protein n=1 Tax=Vibrio alginolyticus TaxID=663 RepID=UPI000A1F3030|nr:hypothetical protein [Vibrio alginolyticus]EGR0718705.1 hypothetical protein [Vibrio alginolyticus]MCR9591816.1 hypothetical protein [Vibrio alginolyticus]OSP13398.1 hypothetical protein B7489_08790 [Vibrio alginolyticus]